MVILAWLANELVIWLLSFFLVPNGNNGLVLCERQVTFCYIASCLWTDSD